MYICLQLDSAAFGVDYTVNCLNDKFFNLYEAGKIIEAVDSIYSSNRWIDRKSDDIEKLKAQFVGVSSLVGEYHGKTLLGKKDINERLISVTYMALYERQPVRLEFVFYRPKDKWVIYSIIEIKKNFV